MEEQKNKYERICFVASEELVNDIKQTAKDLGLNTSNLVRFAVKNYIDKVKKNKEMVRVK